MAPASLHDTLLTFHIDIYWTIIALLTVHILAALKHHFIDRDQTMLRTLPFKAAARKKRG